VIGAMMATLGAALAQPTGDHRECTNADGSPNRAMSNIAASCGDMFAWLKFIEFNTPDALGNLVWEMWSTDQLTFPSNPQPSRCGVPNPPEENCPVWPVSLAQSGLLEPSKRSDALHPPDATASVRAAAEAREEAHKPLGLLTGETVRRSRAAFDYIVAHDLWYAEGIAARFREGFRVEFPIDAVELKVNLLPMRYVDDPSRYYTLEFDGELHGIIAMHIATKDLPNWFWATFEHIDTPGRCDFTGCSDSFGIEQAFVPPSDVLAGNYPTEQVRPALVQLMERAGLPAVFLNYRLKGSQTTFADRFGEPTLLGNSVTEFGFVQTSSCITCHALAGTDANGRKAQGSRSFGDLDNGQTMNGPLPQGIFFDNSNPRLRFMMYTDFVWAIGFRSKPIGGD
jgi:hypothetical protein